MKHSVEVCVCVCICVSVYMTTWRLLRIYLLSAW